MVARFLWKPVITMVKEEYGWVRWRLVDPGERTNEKWGKQ